MLKFEKKTLKLNIHILHKGAGIKNYPKGTTNNQKTKLSEPFVGLLIFVKCRAVKMPSCKLRYNIKTFMTTPGSCLQDFAIPLKALDTFGNRQRPVFSLFVSQHVHKITNL